MAFGPLQLLIVSFPEPNFSGEILAELDRLREHDLIRLIDALAPLPRHVLPAPKLHLHRRHGVPGRGAGLVSTECPCRSPTRARTYPAPLCGGGRGRRLISSDI